MKKSNVEDAGALRIQKFRNELFHLIETYLVEHECTIWDAMTLIPMTLYEVFESIAKSEEISSDEVFGTFVKAFGTWDYLKKTKEG